MLFAEFYHTSLPTQLLSSLHVNMQSAQVNQEQGCLKGFLKIDKSSLSVIAMTLVVLALKLIFQKKKDCGQKEKSLDVTNDDTIVSMLPMKEHLCETIQTVPTSSTSELN